MCFNFNTVMQRWKVGMMLITTQDDATEDMYAISKQHTLHSFGILENSTVNADSENDLPMPEHRIMQHFPPIWKNI